MQPSCAAETEERKVARVVSALDGNQSYRLFHVVIHHVDHALREFFRALPRASPIETAKNRNHTAFGKSHRSAQKELWTQAAKNEIRIGDSEPFSFAIADRTRIGSSAFRPDFQGATGIEFGDGPSAGADGMNVHHGNADRHSVDLAFMSNLDVAVAKGYIGRGSTHIEGDDLRVATNLRHVKRANDAACGPRKNRTSGRGRRGLR